MFSSTSESHGGSSDSHMSTTESNRRGQGSREESLEAVVPFRSSTPATIAARVRQITTQTQRNSWKTALSVTGRREQLNRDVVGRIGAGEGGGGVGHRGEAGAVVEQLAHLVREAGR